MTTDAAGASTIANRVLLTDGGWTLVEFVSEQEALRGAEQLRDELAHEAEAAGETARVDVVPFSDAPSLVRRLQQLGAADIAILTHLDAMNVEQLSWLELHRGVLINGPRIVFAASKEAAELLCSAGNLLTWLGGRRYKFDKAEGAMDVDARLNAIRALHQMDDKTMVTMVQEKRLPHTPEIVEWLILTGRDDLLDD